MTSYYFCEAYGFHKAFQKLTLVSILHLMQTMDALFGRHNDYVVSSKYNYNLPAQDKPNNFGFIRFCIYAYLCSLMMTVRYASGEIVFAELSHMCVCICELHTIA